MEVYFPTLELFSWYHTPLSGVLRSSYCRAWFRMITSERKWFLKGNSCKELLWKILEILEEWNFNLVNYQVIKVNNFFRNLAYGDILWFIHSLWHFFHSTDALGYDLFRDSRNYKQNLFSSTFGSGVLMLRFVDTIDNSHYRLILKLGKEMQINHHS